MLSVKKMKICLFSIVQTRDNYTFYFTGFNGELKFKIKNIKLGI